MSISPPVACRNPLCSNPAIINGLCEKCAVAEDSKVVYLPESKFTANQQWKHLYQCKRWKQLRDGTLRRDIICVICKHRPSTVADHKKDHRGNLVLFYSPNNVQGVCTPCHDEKTGSMHGIGNRKESLGTGLDNNGRVVDPHS